MTKISRRQAIAGAAGIVGAAAVTPFVAAKEETKKEPPKGPAWFASETNGEILNFKITPALTGANQIWYVNRKLCCAGWPSGIIRWFIDGKTYQTTRPFDMEGFLKHYDFCEKTKNITEKEKYFEWHLGKTRGFIRWTSDTVLCWLVKYRYGCELMESYHPIDNPIPEGWTPESTSDSVACRLAVKPLRNVSPNDWTSKYHPIDKPMPPGWRWFY